METKLVYFAASKSAREWRAPEIEFIMSVLNDERAWPFRWRRSMNASMSNWSISLETSHYIDVHISGAPGSRTSGPLQNGLSVTMMRKRPRETYFSMTNWTHVPGTLPDYTRKEYRTYLVLHECGHALGLGHKSCKGTGPVPIMHQQTRGNKECSKNIWPLAFEINSL